jgi:hypothetical protein
MGAEKTKGRRWGRVAALVVAIGLLGTFLVLGSLNTVQVECSLCVTYRGQTDCRTGSGADETEARQAAMKAACGLMAAGMTETVACQNTTPTNVQCQTP